MSSGNDSLLLITAGRTDVQWLAHGRQGLVRVLMQGRSAWRWLLDNPRRCQWALHPAVGLWPELTGKCRLGAPPPSGWTFLLHPPKLAPWLMAWQEVPPSLRPRWVLVLQTARKPHHPQAAHEPAGVGTLLADAANRCWAPGAGADGLEWAGPPWQQAWHADEAQPLPAGTLSWLVDDEDAARPADQAQALARVQAALLASRNLGAQRVLLADTGGLPPLKEPLRLLCTALFGEAAVHRLHTPGPAGSPLPGPAPGEAPLQPLLPAQWMCWVQDRSAPQTPAAAAAPRAPLWLDGELERDLRLRSTVRQLLKKADFAALGGLLGPHPPAAPVRAPGWRDTLRWATDLVAGVDEGPCPEGLCPLGNDPSRWASLPAGARALLRMAWQVEAALARGDHAGALTATVEWAEMATSQAILQRLRQWLRCDALEIGCEGRLGGLPPLQLSDVTSLLAPYLTELRSAFPQRRDWGVLLGQTPWALLSAWSDGPQGPAVLQLRRVARPAMLSWCRQLAPDTAGPLEALHKALNREVPLAAGGTATAYQLRNAKAHGGLSCDGGPRSLQAVSDVMTGARVWNLGPQAPGAQALQRFSAYAPVTQLLQVCTGLPQPAQLLPRWLCRLDEHVCAAPVALAPADDGAGTA